VNAKIIFKNYISLVIMKISEHKRKMDLLMPYELLGLNLLLFLIICLWVIIMSFPELQEKMHYVCHNIDLTKPELTLGTTLK